jgi:hypothetical protein
MSFKYKSLLYLTIISAALIACWVFFGGTLFANTTPTIWTAVAIAILFLCEIMTIFVTDAKREILTANQLINLFLGLKVGKMILSILFIGIYAISVKMEVKRFVLIFLAIYFIYLLFDTLFLVAGEKKLKIKKKTE